MLFLLAALFVGVSVSAQQLPDVKIENQEGKVVSTNVRDLRFRKRAHRVVELYTEQHQCKHRKPKENNNKP